MKNKNNLIDRIDVYRRQLDLRSDSVEINKANINIKYPWFENTEAIVKSSKGKTIKYSDKDFIILNSI